MIMAVGLFFLFFILKIIFRCGVGGVGQPMDKIDAYYFIFLNFELDVLIENKICFLDF